MLRAISKCPYCQTVIAADWGAGKIVFNPDSVKPVCQHVVYINGRLTKWRDDFRRVEFTDSDVGYFSPALDDEAFSNFVLVEYLHALQWSDPPDNPVDPNADYQIDE